MKYFEDALMLQISRANARLLYKNDVPVFFSPIAKLPVNFTFVHQQFNQGMGTTFDKQAEWYKKNRCSKRRKYMGPYFLVRKSDLKGWFKMWIHVKEE